MTNTRETQAQQVPLSELRAAAHKHYDELATQAHHWMSTIPHAIDCYFDQQEAVAASGSPPSPTPLNAKDKQDAERWRMFISKAHAGVTEDGDIWCGFSGGEPDDYTDVLTIKQVETLNNDDPSPRMAKDIVRRLIDDLVGARASSGSTGAPGT